MNPVAAHRLLNAPTAIWIAYQAENPHWGVHLSQCMRDRTVSPLAMTNNLRKLSDCMADPNIEPLLCDWFSKHFISRTGVNDSSVERVQKSLAKCVRVIQLQAILQGHCVNILPKLENLLALSGNPIAASKIWNSWLIDDDDIYTSAPRMDEYFINGKSLGTKKNLKKTLSQYQQFVIDTMVANPETAKNLEFKLPYKLVTTIDGGSLRTSHALLWKHSRLENALKYALAYDWANDKSFWSTYEDDIKLSPKKTQHWIAWALHAKTYLAFAGTPTNNFGDMVAVLRSCPTLSKPIDRFEKLDDNLFNDSPSMLQ